LDRWYSSFVVGIIMLLFILFIIGNLRQAILTGVGFFVVFFLIYIFSKKENKKK